MMQMRVLLLMATMIVLAQPAPATAQRRGERGAWSEGAWSEGGWPEGDGRVVTQANAEPSKRIDVDTFRAADAGAALGKGRIVVVEATPPAPPPRWIAVLPLSIPTNWNNCARCWPIGCKHTRWHRWPKMFRVL